MARPHTCFVQAQSIPWRHGKEPNPAWETDVKILSRDDNDDGYTCIMKVPSGFDLPGPVHFRCNFYFFVLDGGASSLASQGLWYDALDAVSNLVDSNPGQSTYRDQRASLLEQIDLAEVAAFDRGN